MTGSDLQGTVPVSLKTEGRGSHACVGAFRELSGGSGEAARLVCSSHMPIYCNARQVTSYATIKVVVVIRGDFWGGFA